MFNHLTQTQKGMALALTGYTAFAFSDANVKFLTEKGYSTFQIITVDTAIGAVLMLSFARFLGGLSSLRDRENAKIHALRVFFNTGVNFLFVYCVSFMPLVSIYTVIFTLPFVAAIISIPVYGENVGLHRWASIVVGFCGVLVAFQPWKAETDFIMLGLAMLTTLFIAMMFLVSRSLKQPSLLAVGFYPVIGSCLLTMPFAIATFNGIEPSHFIFFVLSGVFMSTGVICVSMAFKLADSAAVSPIVYTEILWAIIFGVLVFGDIPLAQELAGAVIIILSGLYLVYREQQHAKPEELK